MVKSELMNLELLIVTQGLRRRCLDIILRPDHVDGRTAHAARGL